MPKSIELCQLVARAISHSTWSIPRIRDGYRRLQNIDNSYLVENPTRINGHDLYEDAIFRAQAIMQELGWETEITDRQLPAGGSPSPIQSIACIAAPRHTAAIT